MKFVNLTPHKLNIHNGDGSIVTIKPSGKVARVEVEYERVGQAGNIDLYKAKYGEVDGLPVKLDNVYYIVSGMVKAAIPDNEDVLSPGELIRDEDGKPIGCRGLKV